MAAQHLPTLFPTAESLPLVTQQRRGIRYFSYSKCLQVCAILLLSMVCISLPQLVSASSKEGGAEFNERALAIAQSPDPNMAEAASLFASAVRAQRALLKSTRKELREELENLSESELEVEAQESNEVLSALRAHIREIKKRLAEFLNNNAVCEMRRSNFYLSQRLLRQALIAYPDHVDSPRNLKELEKLMERMSSKDEPDEEQEEEESQKRREKEKARKEEKERKKKKGKSKKEEKAEETKKKEEASEEKPDKKKAKKSSSKDKEEEEEEKPSKRRPQPTPDENDAEVKARREAIAKQDKKKGKKAKRRLSALDRPRRKNTNVRRQFPRIHVAHLWFPENKQYAEGREPFVLVGALDDWEFQKNWNPQTFGTLYPEATADFYPHNMDKASVRPYLISLPQAIKEQAQPSGLYPESETHPGTYIQWNVNWRDWESMRTKHMGKKELPSIFRQDDPWLRGDTTCFGSKELADQYTLRTHWRMLLIGNRGAGMFNHQDVLRTSSWQAQVAGAKRWHICSPTQSRYLYGAGTVDAFDPDYDKYPLFAQADCVDDIVETGEMVFYPADFWHQTENVRTPTISVSASIMDNNNHLHIITELEAECERKKYNWGFSPELCKALRERCFPMWKRIYSKPLQQNDSVQPMEHDEL